MTPRTGGTLRISAPADIQPKNTPYLIIPANGRLIPLVYDTLVSYDPQLTARPRLATSWEWSQDARRLTVHLRPGVNFHSGRPFTSAEAKFNLEHVRDPSVGSQWARYASLMTISTPDAATLVMDYDAPVKSSFDALAGVFMADPQTLDDTQAGHGFVGTGPFRFQEWVQGDHFSVSRNPDYWQPGKPYLDQVEQRVMPDLQAAVTALETNNVDWVSGVPGQDAVRLQHDPTYQVLPSDTGGLYYYVGLDLSFAALADQRVRQAFSYALNRQRMIDSALYGFGRPASIVWPRQSPGYDAAQDQTYTYDLTRARQLLQAANWDPATVVPLALAKSQPETVTMAEIYQADLATIGVNVVMQEIDDADFISRLANGRFGGAWMYVMAFMNFSPATFLNSSLAVRIPNPSHFGVQRYQDLVALINSATDDQQLKGPLHELTQIMLDEPFVVPIAEARSPSLARSAVHNTDVWDIWGDPAYEEIWLDQ
jgi:peptide/nickel transport system substrate-binding protein